MKNKNALRPGNIVFNFGIFEKVAAVDDRDYVFESGNGCQRGTEYHCSLTPENLKRANFEPSETLQGAYEILMPGMTPEDVPMPKLIYLNGNLFLETSDGQIQMPLWDKQVRGELFMHNIQNIFWELNGIELPVDISRKPKVA